MLQTAQPVPQAGELLPDTTVSVAEVFGLDVDLKVPAYSKTSERVPDIDPEYIFDKRTTLSILAGFANDWRIDLIGKDAIVLEDGKQVTTFVDGILPWCYQRNVALVFDEYDAGRPDVMFVIQRVLESSGQLTLLDQSRVLRPHPAFRFFATAKNQPSSDGSMVDYYCAELFTCRNRSKSGAGQSAAFAK